MSGHEAATLASSVKEGYYIATDLTSKVQVGYDSFVVREVDGSVVVDSKHTFFGGSVPVQIASFTLDADWTPRRLDITAGEMAVAVVEFGETNSTIYARTSQGEQQMQSPVGRHRAYFMMSGGLYFPMHIVRRFRFDDAAPQFFDLVPSGILEVRRIEDLVEAGETFRQLEVRFWAEGMEDFAYLVVNSCGDMVRYFTRNQNLLVKLETQV